MLVNLKTARLLNLELPPSLLAVVHRVPLESKNAAGGDRFTLANV